MTECLCPMCRVVETAPNLPAMFGLPDASDNWQLSCHWLSPLVNGRAVLIKRGFTTDGASIPRIAWRVIGHPFSKNLLPHALAHDALYAAELLPRAECDAFFLKSMAESGTHFSRSVSLVKRDLVWAAVRIGGGFVWSGHTLASVEGARRNVRLLDETEWDAVRIGGQLPRSW